MVDRYRSVDVWRKTPGGIAERRDDIVVQESPVTIYLNGDEIVTLLCTPEYLEDLAVGFLASEGMLKGREELKEVTADYDKGQVWVSSNRPAPLAGQLFVKRYLTTGCGKGTTFYNVLDATRCRTITSDIVISTGKILELMRHMHDCSSLYRLTGGVHSAALCSIEEIVVFREDVGRHNAADKIAGKCFREGVDLSDKLFLSSGRISSEILVKVSKMGVPILVSRSAPTDLGVKMAEELGITLVGFARGTRLNIYSHQTRIL